MPASVRVMIFFLVCAASTPLLASEQNPDDQDDLQIHAGPTPSQSSFSPWMWAWQEATGAGLENGQPQSQFLQLGESTWIFKSPIVSGPPVRNRRKSL